MNEKNFKRAVYIIIAILILIFFTKDIDLKSKFYKEMKTIENPDDLLVLVNKNNKLPEKFIPKDLEEVSLDCANEGKMLVKEAREQFENLCKNSQILGYKILAVSAY